MDCVGECAGLFSTMTRGPLPPAGGRLCREPGADVAQWDDTTDCSVCSPGTRGAIMLTGVPTPETTHAVWAHFISYLPGHISHYQYLVMSDFYYVIPSLGDL